MHKEKLKAVSNPVIRISNFYPMAIAEAAIEFSVVG